MKHAVTLFLLVVITWSMYTSYTTLIPCARIITYSIGSVDKRFDISEEELKQALLEAEALWEDERGSQLFEYDPSSSFKVDLVYDERQQRTQESIHDASILTDLRNELDTLRAEHDRLIERYNSLRNQYESSRSESNRRAVNEASRDANQKGEQLNTKVREYNRMVANFNEKFGKGFEFNQGVYTGKNISIYQFTSFDDLVTVLAHEFGHALHIDHVADSDALMYYKIDKTSQIVHTLTQDDKNALSEACKFTLK